MHRSAQFQVQQGAMEKQFDWEWRCSSSTWWPRCCVVHCDTAKSALPPMVNLLSRMSYGFFFFFFHHPCNTWYLQFTGFSSCVRDLKRVSWKTSMGRIVATSPGRQGRGQSKPQHSTRAWAPRWEVLRHTWKSSAQETELLTATCLLMCPSLIDNNKIARKKMCISSEKKTFQERNWSSGSEAQGLELRDWSSGTEAQGLELMRD